MSVVDVEVDASGNTPLHRFAAGEMEIDAELLNNVNWLNGKNAEGDTPLHMAAKHGHLDRCRYLLDHGADPLSRNNRNRTPRSQLKISPEIKALLMDAEEAFKERRRQRDAELWDEKMKATQTDSAFGLGVV